VAARADELGVPPLLALEATIRETLLARAAAAEGLASNPELKARVDAERRRLAAQHLVETTVYPSIRATDQEVEALYHLHADQVRLSMVARKTLPEANEVLERLRNGDALVELAKDSPDPMLQAKSGVLGWVERGELAPALAAAAFAAPLDRPNGPVAVPIGWVVFLVHDRKLGAPNRLAAQASELRARVEVAKRETAVREYEVCAAARRYERRLLAATYVRRMGDAVPPPTAAEVEARFRQVDDGQHTLEQLRVSLTEEMRRERAQAAIDASVNRLRAGARVLIDEAALAAAVAPAG
jgi:hypothetical protein